MDRNKLKDPSARFNYPFLLVTNRLVLFPILKKKLISCHKGGEWWFGERVWLCVFVLEEGEGERWRKVRGFAFCLSKVEIGGLGAGLAVSLCFGGKKKTSMTTNNNKILLIYIYIHIYIYQTE